MWIYVLTGIPVVLLILWKFIYTCIDGNHDYWPKPGVPPASEVPEGSKAMTEKSSKENLSLCPVCNAEAEKTCGTCTSVSYCSAEHQTLHWKIHKNVCSPFTIKETETMGKGWFAARDLPADTILLNELPVLFGPHWKYSLSCCLACGIAMISTQNEDRKCSACFWPICSAKCEKNSLHSENECKFFSAHQMTPSNSDPISAWNRSLILIIRASNLKVKNKNLFDELMKLQDFQVIRNISIKLKRRGLRTCENEQSIVSRTHLTDDEYAKLVRIIDVNCFATYPTPHSDKETIVVYLRSSRMNYSCAPTCIASLGTPPDFIIRVRTSVPVKKGESLTISYYDEIAIQPTPMRQHFLQNDIGFMCKCERCLDPTELGTFLSGIKCPSFRCQKSKRKQSGDGENSDSDFGYFLPENPLDLSFDSETGPLFKCNGCGDRKLFSVLKKSLPYEIQRAFDVDLSERIETAEAFLAKYGFETGGKYLHKNHYLIHNLVQEIIPSPNKIVKLELNKQDLQRVVCQLEYLLKIYEMLFPGLSEREAVASVQLMWAVYRLVNQFYLELGVSEVLRLSAIARTCYKKGIKYFKKDTSLGAQNMLMRLQCGKDFFKC